MRKYDVLHFHFVLLGDDINDKIIYKGKDSGGDHAVFYFFVGPF